MGVAPKSVASFGVQHSQKYVAHWSLLVVIGNAVLLDVTVLDCAGLPTGCDDVATLIGVSGKNENKVSLLSVFHNLKSSPPLELSQCLVSHSVHASLIFEVNGLGRLNSRRSCQLFLGLSRTRSDRTGKSSKHGEV